MKKRKKGAQRGKDQSKGTVERKGNYGFKRERQVPSRKAKGGKKKKKKCSTRGRGGGIGTKSPTQVRFKK